MKRLIAVTVLALVLFTGPFHASANGLDAQAGYASSAINSACGMMACDDASMPDGGLAAVCLDHCLNAAAVQGLPTAIISVTAVSLLAFALLAARQFADTLSGTTFTTFSDTLRKILARRQVATVILRN